VGDDDDDKGAATHATDAVAMHGRAVAPRASALDKRCSYDGRGRVAASFISSSAAVDNTASAAAATAHIIVMMTHRCLVNESHLLGGRRHFNGR